MNKSKILLLSLILILSGCAANTDEAPSATTAATTTTAAATTQATTTSAQTTAVTEKSEPAETTAVTTTVATTTTATTTEPEIVEDATPGQEQQHAQDRQDMAENTDAYTTDGIPLTSRGNLTAPAKPTANYKLPDDAQLAFTGNASTALLTELPEGCYWVPDRGGSENAFMDPAGNLWLNTVTNTTTNRGEGYYSPDGTYHHSQAETDRAIAFNEELAQNDGTHDPGSTTAGMTQEQKDNLQNLFGG